MALFDGIRNWFRNITDEAGYGDDPLNRDEEAGWQPGDLIGRIAGDVRDHFTNFRQDTLEQETFEYNQWLNQEKMDREDTAVTRRAEDLENAGLSPTLAAGSAAGAGAGNILGAPKSGRADRQAESMKNMLQLLMGKAEISRTESQRDLLLAQASKTNAETTAIKGREGRELSLHPGSLLAQTLANNYSGATVDDRIATVASNAYTAAQRGMQAHYDQTIRRLQVRQAEVNEIKAALEAYYYNPQGQPGVVRNGQLTTIRTDRPSPAVLDIMAKQLAIDIQEKTKRMMDRQYRWYPVSATTGALGGAARAIGTAGLLP